MKKIFPLFILLFILSFSNAVAQKIELAGEVYITSKLGIGTNTPQQRIDARGFNENSGARLLLGNSDLSHKLILFPGQSGNPRPHILWKDGDPLRFGTDGGGFSERFRIASDGLITAQNRITNVTDPMEAQDATTKAYVDKMLISFGLTFGSAGIQKLLDAGYCPLEIINAGAIKDSLYGKFYQGGLIFYLDDLDTISGIKGLVSAPIDQSEVAEWGCPETDLPNVPNVPVLSLSGTAGQDIGDGRSNTDSIFFDCPSPPAVLYCRGYNGGGFNDWFLPSVMELNEMYLKIGPGAPAPITNIGGFASGIYWSSTEGNSNFAWGLKFLPPAWLGENKNNGYSVRTVRAF